MTGRCDVLLYVQHLLGIGHIRRAAVLARAFQKAGLKVVFVTGGLPVEGLGLDAVDVVQLPAGPRTKPSPSSWTRPAGPSTKPGKPAGGLCCWTSTGAAGRAW